ncbi:sickle tail protein isoform X5 [Alosa sapidissima]|uniref:sickle tail protein isoform X5 n=1 Tax=Alosa sapidissima TaxID=34773 RepID=UPI001C09B15B|nr:sickle tail protein isoform X5 [Alosa sapidissima]
MMSKPSRLAKPSKSSGRKEPPGSRSRMLSVGERLMRAGSEGNLVRPRATLQQQQAGHHESHRSVSPLAKEVGNISNQRLSATENEALSQHHSSSADDSDHSDPWSPRTLPRRYTVGGPRSAGDAQTMQPHHMDRKREAFLEHLKQKYPHHASTIMGHQERIRDQIRLPKHSASPQPGLGAPGEPLSVASLESLEAMSEGGDPPSAFTRGTRSRASLPVVRSANQTKDRSLGVLYLQYGEDTKQIRMPNEITGADTIRALFVSAFPQLLTMKMLESPSMAVYIKDDMRNIYYELTDVRNITPHSCLKVYHKDPAQAFSHNSKPNNGDVRVHREKMYVSRDGQHSLRQAPSSPISSLHALQGSMSPPTARSMPSSPSRIPFGPRPSLPLAGSATLPRERLASAPQPTSRSVTPCPSAILERRDVKPDEDLGSGSKSMALYEPYGHPEGRLSVSSSQGPGDAVDGALQQQPPPQQHSLYRQKSRKYAENPMASLGGKAQPPSPHRVNEVRMIDMPPQGVPVERGSSMRRSFRKDSNGTMEVVASVHGSMVSPVFVDLPPGHGTRPFQTGVPPGTHHTSERMKAMEQQIASLTGLVQHALLKGPNASATKDTTGEKPVRTASPANSGNSGGVSPVPVPKNRTAQSDSMAVVLHSSAKDTEMQSMLSTFRRNVSDLRLQLHQLKQMQLQNQDSMKVMLRRAEQEITGRFTDMLRHLEDPVQKQRSQVDQERHTYLAMEEKVLIQLGELEKYVERLKKDSASRMTQRPITLKDVEEGAVNLRKVGEALAGLKGEFPGLQTKMRSVLRVEVEAVRFLKEEPHKMDSMLKRVKALTETLSCLRRCATEGVLPSPEPTRAVTAEASPVAADGSDSSGSSRSSPTLGPRSPAGTAIRSELTPSSPVVVHRVRSAPVSAPVCQHSASLGHGHHASPPLTPTHARDSPTVAKVSPRSRESSPALQKRTTLPRAGHAENAPGSGTTSGSDTPPPLGTEEPPSGGSSRGSLRHRGASTEPPSPERQWEEEKEDGEEEEKEEGEEEEEEEPQAGPSPGQPDGAEMERLLQQTQDSLMQAIPSLEVPAQGETPAQPQPDEVEAPLPAASAPELPPKPVADKPVAAAGSAERAQRPAIEKPHRPSVDRARAGSAEKASKSPPPPPPRRFFPSGSGLTTGRSGEVIYASHNRKDSTSAQEGEGEEVEEESTRPKALKVPPEIKPKPQSPPPTGATAPPLTPRAAASAAPSLADGDEEDEGDKIMAELQTPGHQGEATNQTKDGKDSTPQGSRVIYYVTGQISNEHPAADTAEQKEGRERTLPQTKVAHANAFDLSQKPKLLTSAEFPTVSHKAAGQCPSAQPSTQHTDRSGPWPVCPETERSPNPEPVLSQAAQKRNAAPAKPSAVTQKPVNGVPGGQATTAPNGENLVNEEVVMRSNRGRLRYAEESGLSPDLPDEEGPPPPSTDSIAFMITQTKVQALSTGEYKDLVNNTNGGDMQTVKVGMDQTVCAPEDCGFDRKPVIIIFDEPMEIRQAYKRLSTIFEGEEELDRMLSEDRIDEESEEEEEEERQQEELERRARKEIKAREVTVATGIGLARTDKAELKPKRPAAAIEVSKPLSPTEPLSPEAVDGSIPELSLNDPKQDAKKKFKFKFPKKQLAAIGQALRTGTKTGKKTLQVVVYEDEEELDGTTKELKVAKRFEIHGKSKANQTSSSAPVTPSKAKVAPQTQRRTEEIRKNTFKTLDSLEETIKELESTISDMGPKSQTPPQEPSSPRGGTKVKRSVSDCSQTEGSPSKRTPPHESSKAQKGSSLRKKAKPHLLPRPSATSASGPSPSSGSSSSSSSSSSASSKQNSGGSSSTSRPTLPSPKTRQQPGASAEKAGKSQKLQDTQRQFRQANGSSVKTDGDSKHAFLALPASKIPAFCPSSGKGSLSSPNSNMSKPTNPSSASSSSSSSALSSTPISPSKSSIPCLSLGRHIRTSAHALPRPVPSNDSLQLHGGKGQTLSLLQQQQQQQQQQTQNGRPHTSPSHHPVSIPTTSSSGLNYSSSSSSSYSYSSSSSVSPTSTSSSSSPSSPSLLSPTAVAQGGRGGRAAHLHGIGSVRPQGGSSAPPAITPTSSSRDMA